MARVLAPGGRLVIGDASADLMTARIADVSCDISNLATCACTGLPSSVNSCTGRA